MSPIQILADAETVLAFALGGIPGRVVRTADEARAAMESAVSEVHATAAAERQPALLLVTQETAELIRTELNRVTLDSTGPVVLEIPGFGEGLGRSSLERFVQRVLGVRL